MDEKMDERDDSLITSYSVFICVYLWFLFIIVC
jgi:hypothetical protein